MSNKTIDNLLSFLDNSPSPYLAVKNASEMLSDATMLDEKDEWKLEAGKKYFVTRAGTALIAFKTGHSYSAFHLAAAHTDSPALKIKPDSEEFSHGSITVGVEVYGGPIISTWLDRELGISGNAVIRTEDGLKNALIFIDKPIAVVPNAPIHLNREINKGFEYNQQKHLRAVLKTGSEEGAKGYIKRIIADQTGCNHNNVVAFDLFFHPAQKATLMGNRNELIASARLDNLAMCHAILCAFSNAAHGNATSVAVLFDAEEIGSRTTGGADGNFLDTVLERITYGLGGSREDFLRAKSSGFLLSNDMAHAYNPNYAEKFDPGHICTVNGGVVLKVNANMKYCTTSITASRVRELCSGLNIPLQVQINRSDIPSGSTIGPISSSASGIAGADMGNPMLAMHSSREFAGVTDHLDMIRLISEFYSLN